MYIMYRNTNNSCELFVSLSQNAQIYHMYHMYNISYVFIIILVGREILKTKDRYRTVNTA